MNRPTSNLERRQATPTARLLAALLAAALLTAASLAPAKAASTGGEVSAFAGWNWFISPDERWGYGPPRPIDLPVTEATVSSLAVTLGLAGDGWTLDRSRRQGHLRVIDFEQQFNGRSVFESRLRLVIGPKGLVACFCRGATERPRSWQALSESRGDVTRHVAEEGGVVRASTEGWHLGPNGRVSPAVEFTVAEVEPEGRARIRYSLSTGGKLERKPLIARCTSCGSFAAPGVLGLDPDGPTATLAPLPLPNLELTAGATGETIWTDPDGNWCLDDATCSVESISFDALTGPHVVVEDASGDALAATFVITPGQTNPIALPGTPTPEDLAEIHAFYHVNRVRDWFGSLALDPPFEFEDPLFAPLPVRVNTPGSCSAGFDPNFDPGAGQVPHLFFAGSGACANASYSSVIHHEYGHAIVFEILGGFPAFDLNEGLADALATLHNGGRTIARDFYGPGQPVRDVEPDRIHPVVGDVWTRGLVVGGSFFDLRTRLIHELGFEEGATLASTLFAKSLSFMPDQIGDTVGVAVLLADDDDGDLTNGTPHDEWIIDSFAIHGLLDDAVIVDPIRQLTDTIDNTTATLTWFNVGPFDEIIVERDGAQWATLPGTATSFVDPDVPPGLHTYLIRGRLFGIDGTPTPRLVLQDLFRRGDANGDGVIEFTDAFVVLDHLHGSAAPLPCPDAADFGDDGRVNLQDVTELLGYLFT
ncbi:MAG: dockerin type I repeat-containing protein, partial [Planctomycetota bacterium]